MTTAPTIIAFPRISLVAILLLAPIPAFANFFWPPALYYGGLTVWWAIPAGLGVECLILSPIYNLPRSRLFRVVLIANFASAVVGIIATWPVVFWEKGVDAFVNYESAIFGIIALIFVGNVLIEYTVSVRWLGIPRGTDTLGSLFIANMISFIILVATGLTLL